MSCVEKLEVADHAFANNDNGNSKHNTDNDGS